MEKEHDHLGGEMMDRLTAQKEHLRKVLCRFVSPGILKKLDGITDSNITDSLLDSDQFREIERIFKLVPPSMWDNYAILNITDLTEQNLMDDAINAFKPYFRLVVSCGAKQTDDEDYL